MRDLIEAKKRKTLIRLVSSDSNGDFTFQIGDAFYSGTVDPAVLFRIEAKAKRAPGKALAMAKKRTTLKKQEDMEDEMRDLLERISGAKLDEARGGSKKTMLNDLKGLSKDLGDGMDVIERLNGKAVEEITETTPGATSKRLIKAKTDFIKKQADELSKVAAEMQKTAKGAHWAIANGLFHVAARVENHVRRALDDAERAMESMPPGDAAENVQKDWARNMKDGYYR